MLGIFVEARTPMKLKREDEDCHRIFGFLRKEPSQEVKGMLSDASEGTLIVEKSRLFAEIEICPRIRGERSLQESGRTQFLRIVAVPRLVFNLSV